MLKKRLVGVITVKSSWAVQSFGYKKYLPVGKPEIVAENLDRWGADEILILDIDRTSRNLGPNFDLLKTIVKRGLSTPLVYGGGVRSGHDATEIIRSGAERVCVDSLLHDAPERVKELTDHVGAQAVIAALPLSNASGSIQWYNYRTQQVVPLDPIQSLFQKRLISEALIIDHLHEGIRGSFDMDLVKKFPFIEVPLIVFGGISEEHQVSAIFNEPSVIAAGVGNFLNYTEHAIQTLKAAAPKSALRPAHYHNSYPEKDPTHG